MFLVASTNYYIKKSNSGILSIYECSTICKNVEMVNFNRDAKYTISFYRGKGVIHLESGYLSHQKAKYICRNCDIVALVYDRGALIEANMYTKFNLITPSQIIRNFKNYSSAVMALRSSHGFLF